jgi:transketolase
MKLPNAATIPTRPQFPTRAFAYEELPKLIDTITGDEKHSSASTSTLDVLWVLYDQILFVSPDHPDDPERDRFILSKGHGPASYYAVLAAKGYIDPHLLADLGSFESPLGHHPDRLLIPGVEISSGSLGHGLAIAAGIALGLQIQGRTRPRVICLLGDGELEEGSNHEAIAVGARLSLDSLTAIVVDNDNAELRWPGGLATRFEVEGWHVATVAAHDHATLARALALRSKGAPNLVVARMQGHT